MEIHRRMYSKISVFGARNYFSFVRVTLTDEEIDLANRYRLFAVRVDPSMIAEVAPEVRAVMNRIRNRWDLVMRNTTGWVFLDLLGALIGIVFRVILGIGRVFFGTRVPFRDMGRGIVLKASTSARLHEKETHVFMRLAAIQRALEYGHVDVAEQSLDAADLSAVVPGLTFAGDVQASASAQTQIQNWLSGSDAESAQHDADFEEDPDIDLDTPDVGTLT